MENQEILPDVLQPGLSVAFCGTAVGKASAEAKAYYAHPNNKFWTALADTKLTNTKIKPHEFESVTKFGIGLTDLCKRFGGNDDEIPNITKEDCAALESRIRKYRPLFLAFTSLTAGRKFCGSNAVLGLQAKSIDQTAIYVLPSTSLSAAWNWNKAKSHWDQLAVLIRAQLGKS